MKYIEALKKYNEGKDKWCMPRKGSEDYLNIIRMMKPISKKKDKLDLLNVSGRNNNCFFNSIYLVIKDNNDFKKSSRYSIKKGEDLRKYLCKKFIKEANIKKTIKKYQTYLELAQLYFQIPHWVVKADLVRLLLVYFNGGFYCDADCFIQKKWNTFKF